MDILDTIFLIQNTRERTVPLVVAVTLALIGVLLVADQIWWRKRALAFPGRVRGFLAEKGQSATLYRAVVELFLPDGRTLVGKDDSASSSLAGRAVGDEVEVLVTRADFPTVRIHRRGRVQLGVALMAGGSLLGASLWSSGAEGALFVAMLVLQVAAVLYYLLVARPHPSRETPEDPGADLLAACVPEAELARRRAEVARVNRVAAPVGLLVGAVLLAGSASLGWDVLELRAVGASASGTVVRYERLRPGLDAPMYRAVVTFTPGSSRAAGDPVTFTDRYASSAQRWETGEEVAVLYDPARPRRAQVDAGPAGNLLFSVLLGLAALIVLRMSVVAWRSARPGGDGPGGVHD